MTTSVFINRSASTAQRLTEPLVHQLRDHAHVEHHDQTDSLCEAVRTALKKEHKRIIVGGGDGTVSKVASLLLEAQAATELAILPLGTGNDLARALGMCLTDLSVAIEQTRTFEARAADVLTLSAACQPKRAYAINVVHGGVAGRISHDVTADAKAQWGLAAYWLAALRETVDLPIYDCEFEADGRDYSLAAHGVIIGNSCFVGGGIAVAPEARLDDGKMDVVILPAQSAMESVSTAVEVLRGQHNASERTIALQTERLTCRATPPMPYTVDGETGPTDQLSFTTERGALQLVAAPNATAFTDQPAQPFEANP